MNSPECAWCFEVIEASVYRDPESDIVFCGYVCARSFQEFESQFDVDDDSSEGDE